MNIQTITYQNQTVALILSSEPLLTNTQAALDIMMTVKYTTHTNLLAFEKSAVSEEFFKLSSGLAGEILQKFINYRMKIAIFGDFSGYTSKPLHDFIYESNQGTNVFFTATQDEAIQRLINS